MFRLAKRFASTEIEVIVNGKSVFVEKGAALIQACEKAGSSIPRFCYHERLSVAGNCRMCLVQVEKVPKPVASCAYPVTPGMKVWTETDMVHKAREGVLEFMLSNHPLDCPICDQGGECDLQDQSVRYGSDRGRFREFHGKRATEDKDFGPLVKTEMTRCIHCTRCVRFANEVAGAEELGTSGRGNDMQIGTYVSKMINSEMSGNIIDLCPVGALTSKPYEFTSRPWELKKTESVDVLDAIGSNIRVDSRGVEVMRILPRLHEEINEEWINDKTRFACDGLKRQRLTSPMVKEGDSFKAVSWKEAFSRIAEKVNGLKGNDLTAVAGSLADAESLVALKDLFSRMGSSNFRMDTPTGASHPVSGVDFRSNYIFNSGIPAPETSDMLLLIGTNPRHEAAILNARIRKAYLHAGLDIGLVGEPIKTTFEYEHIGTDLKALKNLKGGFWKKFHQAKNPLVIVGSGVWDHSDGSKVYAFLEQLVKKTPNLVRPDRNGLNFLQRTAGATAALDIGFVPSCHSTPFSESKFIYLLNADDIPATEIPKDAFVVYQGHHGDAGAHLADVVLPGAAYTEKSATYVNTEGRSQMTRIAVSPPGDAREDWTIIRALSQVLGYELPYDDVDTLRERMFDYAPHLIHYGQVIPAVLPQVGLSSLSLIHSSLPSRSSGSPFTTVIPDFYLSDVISRASPTMAKCSSLFSSHEEPKQAISSS